MKVPDTNRSVPIPDIFHWLILKYAEKNHIPVEEQFFRNRNRRYTAGSFAEAIVKQCTKSGILDREYIFKGNGYQKELGKALYRYGASIQTIREYMGYSTDEAVRKSIGLDEEEVAEKSDEFFRKESNSLGGGLLMAKYDKMNKVNRQESQKKQNSPLQKFVELPQKERWYRYLNFLKVQDCQKASSIKMNR